MTMTQITGLPEGVKEAQSIIELSVETHVRIQTFQNFLTMPDWIL
jgi:hypothetical protein